MLTSKNQKKNSRNESMIKELEYPIICLNKQLDFQPLQTFEEGIKENYKDVIDDVVKIVQKDDELDSKKLENLCKKKISYFLYMFNIFIKDKKIYFFRIMNYFDYLTYLYQFLYFFHYYYY